MILRYFYDDKLAQASYLVGCAATGEALVVDANRDVDQYIEMAEREGLRITHVTETHIHADYVSGSRELAHRTGAQLYLSDEGDENWKYAFAEEAGAILIKGGDHFMVGNIRIDVIKSAGHTPEHVSFLVTDTAGADQPIGIFTGDHVFVGDVGRPDLLEKAAGVKGTMEAGARVLFRSLEEFKKLPDFVQVWPAHGAGSACGKSLGAVPSSTVGYEKLFNWGLQFDDEEAFVQAVLEGQPEPPKYFAEMKRINKEGPRILGGMPRPERMADERIADVVESDAIVIDTRRADDYADAHVPGTINIPLNRSFITWAGWFVPYDRDIYLLVGGPDAEARVDEAVRDLAMIGLDRVAGWFEATAVDHWAASGKPLAAVEQMDVDTLRERMREGEVHVVDVRGQTEWEAGHLPGVENIPAGYITDRLDEIPRDKPVVLHCQGGGRSAIAASVLEAKGFENVINLRGGYAAWLQAGYPTEKGEEG